MAFLSDAELTAMRADAAGLLAETCTIKTHSTGLDELGSGTAIWASVLNVPCKLAPIIQKNQSTEGEQFRVHAGWVLTLAHDQTIASGDEVVKDGDTYTVLAVEDDQTWRMVRRAYLRRPD